MIRPSRALLFSLLYGLTLGIAVGIVLESSGALVRLDQLAGRLLQHKETQTHVEAD